MCAQLSDLFLADETQTVNSLLDRPSKSVLNQVSLEML